jgi:SAM-dependent methyltransferase
MRAALVLAWSPVFFQAARVLRDRGLLKELIASAATGLGVDALAARTDTTPYGVTVLLEAGMSAGLVTREVIGGAPVFQPTQVAYLVERDPMTRANMNFVHDVCYRAMAHLDEAIADGAPRGLIELGDWTTIYEGLAHLKEPARQSWLDFDHFYSDDAFPLIMRRVFAGAPKRVLDVGGNTGKFTLTCLRHDAGVHMTVADLPGQIASCKANVDAAGFTARVSYHPVDLLKADAALPAGNDVIWMSQFLCCFSEPEIVHILTAARRALGPGGRLVIMDTFWDNQPTQAGEVILHATSLYFTALANGNSRMYDATTFKRCIDRAGFRVESEKSAIGWGHTLLECAPA